MTLVGATEAAAILGISRKTLSNYRKRGMVPFAMRLPSGYYRYSAERLHALRAEWNKNDASRPHDSGLTNPL